MRTKAEGVHDAEVRSGEIVKEACVRALSEKGDLVEAASLIEKWCRTDPELHRALTDRHLYRLAYEAVGAVNRRSRSSTRKAVTRRAGKETSDRVLVHAERLLNLPIFGSPRKLRDAYRPDLDESIEGYKKQSGTALHMIHFFGMLKRRMRDSAKTVGETFTEEKLSELFTKAKEEIDAK